MTPRELRNEKLGEQVAAALRRRHFHAVYCPTGVDALRTALEWIPEGSGITWGGSASIHEIGLTEALKKGNYQVYDRASVPQSEWGRFYREHFFTDWFLASANAVSEDGELCFVDGTGNRVAALACGPENVLLIVGMNKVVKSGQDAMRRARTVAAPINAQRFLTLKTPCKETGACADCTGGDCICGVLATVRVSRPSGRIRVILVGESLGF